MDSAKQAVPGLATQMLVQVEVLRPYVAPYLFGGHGVHSWVPPTEKRPGLHRAPTELFEAPSGHWYPGGLRSVEDRDRSVKSVRRVVKEQQGGGR